jgi:hypothetical protein
MPKVSNEYKVCLTVLVILAIALLIGVSSPLIILAYLAACALAVWVFIR